MKRGIMAGSVQRKTTLVKINRRVVASSGRNMSGSITSSDGMMPRRSKEMKIARPVSLETDASRRTDRSRMMVSDQGKMTSTSMASANARQRVVNSQKMTERSAMMNSRGAMTSQRLTETDVAMKRATAQEMKKQAIEKAMSQMTIQTTKEEKSNKMRFGFKRLMLATVCAGLAVFAIVYFVNINAPNVSLRVAAMQIGIEASYPAYVPRDYSLSDITSEEGKVILNFRNNLSGDSFMIIEEKSSWDSNALISNYVEKEYGDDYVVVREQGLSLYISGSDAAWVNGGICFRLRASNGVLTKKQIKNIAVSL